VTSATRSNPLGVYKPPSRATAEYATGTLLKKTTYYWRIDEVAADGGTIKKGTSIWSFKTKSS
jgi:hypothetical protein